MGDIIVSDIQNATIAGEAHSDTITVTNGSQVVAAIWWGYRTGGMTAPANIQLNAVDPDFEREERTDAGNDYISYTAYWVKPAVGTLTCSMTWTGSAAGGRMALILLSNVALSSPVWDSYSDHAGEKTYTGVPRGAVAVACCSYSGGGSWSGDMTSIGDQNLGYSIPSASYDGSIDVTHTGGTYDMQSIVFKPSPDGGSPGMFYSDNMFTSMFKRDTSIPRKKIFIPSLAQIKALAG